MPSSAVIGTRMALGWTDQGEDFVHVELTLRGVRCFESLTLALSTRVTVLIGENGSGKSTVAEAIASLAYGDDEGLQTFPQRRGAEHGSMELEVGEARAGWAAGGSRQRLPSRPWVLVYGRFRGIVLAPGIRPFAADVPESQLLGAGWEQSFASRRTDVEGDRTTTIVRPDPDLMRARVSGLLELHYQSRSDERLASVWERFSASLVRLGEGIEGLVVDTIDGEEHLFLVRKGVRLSMDEVADGYKSVLALIFDLVTRFASVGDRRDPLGTEALVVIDEIDLHLHPRWQRGVVGQLAELFPGVTFLVTTHSPSVVQGAIDQDFDVVLLQDAEPRIRRLRDEQREELRDAELGAIFVSDATFAVGSRYSPEVEQKEQEVVAIRERIEAGIATRDDELRLVQHLEQLQALFARDEGRRGREILLSETIKTQVALIKRSLGIGE